MKPEELRIGNYVTLIEHFDDKYFEVSGIKTDEIYLNDDQLLFNGHQVKPIPLTEQWLKDFGFEEKANVNQDMDDDEFWENDGMIGRLYDSGFELVWHELAPCKYVHQLQNLYFALTGKELTK